MDKFLQDIILLGQAGPLLEQFVDRVVRTTGLYQNGHLPRDSWRHLMIQNLVMNVSDFSAEEKISKIEVNALIQRMLNFDEQPSN
jgi:hypothetical protein